MRRFLLWLLGATLGVALVPRLLCGRAAQDYWEGDKDRQLALARVVAHGIDEHPDALYYRTGQARFDGQSAIAIYQMTVLGLGQILLTHPELREELLPTLREAADRLAEPATLRYAAQVYGQHGVQRMAPGAGHAYLGYINLGLSMLRQVEPGTRHAALNDRLTEQLAARLFAAKTGMIETYPGETWPPDVAAVAGSIGLHARATGRDRRAELDEWAKRFRRCAVAAGGFLVQRLASGGCTAVDAPRGSGTAVGAYFIGFAHSQLARELYEAVARSQRSLVGFGGLREYAAGYGGLGDVNSGPVVLGVSIGASGFGIGAARMHGDRETFVRLTRTAVLFGVLTAHPDGESFAVGGMLGNALLLAMLTARTP